jgi:WD40 repeat protein
VRAVAFPNQSSPQILATGGMEKKLRIFDLSRSSGSASSSPTNPTENGASALNGSSSSSPSTNAPAPSYEIGPGIHGGTIRSIVWAQDQHIIITAAEDKKIRWWDLRTRGTIGEYLVDGVVGTCELDTAGSSDGSPGVLSVAAGKNVYFFDGAQPASLIKHIKMPHETASVALHSGQRKFVTGSSGDTWVRVWDFDEEKELGKHNFILRNYYLHGGGVVLKLTDVYHRDGQRASWPHLVGSILSRWKTLRNRERGWNYKTVEIYNWTLWSVAVKKKKSQLPRSKLRFRYMISS